MFEILEKELYIENLGKSIFQRFILLLNRMLLKHKNDKNNNKYSTNYNIHLFVTNIFFLYVQQ